MIEKIKGGNAKALTPQISHSSNGKDTNYLPQLQRVYESFFEQPKTRLQVAFDEGTFQGNLCWHVRKLRKSNKIVVVKKGHCKVTGYLAEYLTTNPEYFPKQRQLNLFETNLDVIESEGVSK